MNSIIKKELYAVFVDGKQITRYRTDKVRTIAIAKKTSNNLNQVNNPFTSHRQYDIGVLSRTCKKASTNTASFAMIANAASPNIYCK